MKLYKYLYFDKYGDMKHTMDVLKERQLYCASYYQLNDPLESYFQYSSQYVNIGEIQSLICEKSQTKMCCLSKSGNINKMWAYYANSHKGICLEIDNFRKSDITTIHYTKNPPIIDETPVHERAKHILSYKSNEWKYEKEVRYFTNEVYVPIHISCIFVGLKMDTDNLEYLRNVISNNIPIKRMSSFDMDWKWPING